MNDRPSILFSTGVFPPNLGGPAKITQGLAERLTELGYKCQVITFGEDDKVERSYPVERISFEIPQPFRLIKTLLKTMQLARHADLIYTLDTYTNGLTAAFTSKILRKPMILRFTGDSVWETAFNNGDTNDDITSFQKQDHGSKMRYLLWRRNFVLKQAHTIITDCEFLKNLLEVIGIDTKKVTMINNPTDHLPEVEFDRDIYKKANHLKDNVLMTMGRLVPWKGIQALIEVIPDILEKYPETSLAIVGDGPEEDKLKKLSNELQLSKSVIFFGKVTDKQEKRKIYDSTNVFILNTFYEGMSNTILEAMGTRKPVIATRSGGNPEFVNENNGILVDYNDKEQIKNAMLDLLGNAERAKQLGENGFQTAQKYTWDALVEKNENLIQDICQKK